MAINRFYQPGQSQYVSQYVPHKLPFELWQQGLMNKDAEVDAAIAEKSKYKIDPTGLQQVSLPESQRKYYEGSTAEIEQVFENKLVGDYQKSMQNVQNFNNKVKELTTDEIINKVATNDLANSMIELQQLYGQANAENEVFKKRAEWYQNADKLISSKGEDVINSPWLLTQYNQELEKMADPNNPYYVPSGLPVIGKSVDRTKELLTQVNLKKDSGTKSENLQPGELYSRIYSSSGVSAGEYELFATSILDNTNSPIRRDIEAQVNSQINAGILDESQRQTAIDYEIKQLIDVTRNLKHKNTSLTYNAKSQFTFDKEQGEIMYPKDAATEDIINGTAVSLDILGQTSTKARETYDAYIGNISSKLPVQFLQAVGGVEGLANLSKEEIEAYARRYNVGIPTYQLLQISSQISNTKKEVENLENQFKLNDSNARSGTGFSTGNEGTYNFLNTIKRNPSQYINMYNQALNDPNSEFRNTPMFKEMEYIKSGNPQLFNELMGLSTGETNILSMYSSKDFYNNGKFDGNAAKQFLESQGVEHGLQAYGSGPLSEEKFNQLIKTNSKGQELYKSNQTLVSSKEKYDQLANTKVTVTPDKLLTLPGMTMSYSSQELGFMKQFIDPYSSTLTVGNKINNDPYVAFALSETLMNSKTPVVMTMTSGGNYIYEGTASNSILQNPENLMYFKDAYVRKQTGGAINTYGELGETERKQIDESLKSYLGGTSPIHFEIAATKSTAFTNDQLLKLENYNKNINGSDPNFLNSVYTENVILNKDNIESAEKLNSTAGYVSYGDDAKAFGLTPIQTNIQFQIKDYNGGDGTVNTHNIVLTNISPSEVEGSDPYKQYGEATYDINGQPRSWVSDMTSHAEMQVVDGKPIYNYYFTDSSGNLLNGGNPIPATSISEALNQISNSVNVVQQ